VDECHIGLLNIKELWYLALPRTVFCRRRRQSSGARRNSAVLCLDGGDDMEHENALLPYCVYVLLSLKDSDFYVGYTENLSERLLAHVAGRNTSTAPRRPFKLLHVEFYLNKKDAQRRELYLKSTKGRRTLRLMLADGLNELRSKPDSTQ